MTMFQNLRRMMPERSTLKIECEPCGHQATWSQDQALRRLGPDATPFEIRRRLRCAECGVRGRSRVWI